MENLLVYTVVEVAAILKVTERTIYNYIKAGSLKAAKIGKHWRVKAVDLQAFINDSIVTS